MATRPVYLPLANGPAYVRTEAVQFGWVPGLALSQKQKSIAALHQSARALLGVTNILEISSKSTEEAGRALSAFQLTLPFGGADRRISVECAFQGSKVFEGGGPYTDLYLKPSREAKTDPRLKASGRLLAFECDNERWSLEPQTAFYDWLYVRALQANPQLAARLAEFSAFTDIEFNPEKSINCQAYSAALFSALASRHSPVEVTASRESFLAILSEISSPRPRERDQAQGSLF